MDFRTWFDAYRESGGSKILMVPQMEDAYRAGMEHLAQLAYDRADTGGDVPWHFWKDVLPDFEPQDPPAGQEGA